MSAAGPGRSKGPCTADIGQCCIAVANAAPEMSHTEASVGLVQPPPLPAQRNDHVLQDLSGVHDEDMVGSICGRLTYLRRPGANTKWGGRWRSKGVPLFAHSHRLHVRADSSGVHRLTGIVSK